MKIFLLVTIFLSGCGGATTGIQNSRTENSVTYSELNSNFRRLRGVIPGLAFSQSNPQIPISGEAIYAGTTSFGEISVVPQIIGVTNLVARFDSASFGGTISELRASDGTIFSGTLSITNGKINAPESSVTASISGNLTSDSRRMLTVSVKGDLGGDFIGNNHRYITGPASAIWITNEGKGTEERINMEGKLVVLKQY